MKYAFYNSLALNAFLLVIVAVLLISASPERQTWHKPHPPPYPQPAHLGKIVKLGYENNLWAEVVIKNKVIQVFIIDKKGDASQQIQEIAIQEVRRNPDRGISHSLEKQDNYFIGLCPCIDDDDKTDAEIMVLYRECPYYGDLSKILPSDPTYRNGG